MNSIVGHPMQDSWLSLEEIDRHMNMVSETWIRLTTTAKERLAITAAAKISAIQFLGTPFYKRQMLAFPRKGDVRSGTFPWISPALTFVDKGVFSVDIAPAGTPDGCTWVMEDFPYYTPDNPPEVRIVVYGQAWTLYADNHGNLSGDGYTGKLDYTNRTGSLNILPDDGYPLRITSGWKDSTKVQSAEFMFDVQEYEPDHLATGSVHLPAPDGYRDYLSIVGHNIATGVLDLSGQASTSVVDNAIVFEPIHPRVKEAMLIQLKAEHGLLDWDRRAGRGIRQIKIGDTAQSYSESSIPVKMTQLAAKYRVHETVMSVLGPLTIYGKMMASYAQNIPTIQR